MNNPTSPPQPPSTASNLPMNFANRYADLHVKGYPKLAYLFSQSPHVLHLRRFASLSVRLLLYRQHELVMLESRLLELENSDATSSEGERASYRYDYQPLKNATVDDPGTLQEQREVYEKLKKELKDYEDAIIRFDTLGRKGRNPHGIQQIQRWLGQSEACEQDLVGSDATIWGTMQDSGNIEPDVIQILGMEDVGPGTAWLQYKFIPKIIQFWPFRRWFPQNIDIFQSYSLSTRTLGRFANFIGNAIILLLLCAEVIWLSYTSSGKGSLAGLLIFIIIALPCAIGFGNVQNTLLLSTLIHYEVFVRCSPIFSPIVGGSEDELQPGRLPNRVAAARSKHFG
ncbi:hypothetical protein BCR34DRAFT_582182 [Clohesyomyces aquaticus]|uniref:DUF6594 domain-containing protein n=1 Tax=Clohesyomyces aquaticus TaxID=1231657 RepID=A0A1Y2AA72_9PLEO|nr:hypothetical protein BCR34DRAFT_582182 [Clohesyomyces aquaticus]